MKHFGFAAVVAMACTGADAANMPVNFVTDWKAQAEHGGFYEALAEGLYARRGLDVKIVQGGPNVNVPQLLAGGAADFGIGSNAFIALNNVKAGAPIKAVAAIFQKDPQVLITHPRGDVKSLGDMKGKPIMIADASTSAFWPWLKAKYGFQDAQIRKYTFNLAPFLVDDKAIQEGYLTSEPYTIEQKGKFKPQVFLLADNGYPGYANMIVTTDSWIATKPDMVRAFVDASILGWTHYLYGNPKPANALIKRDNPDMTDDLIAQAIAKMKSYAMLEPAGLKLHRIGAMSDARWKTFFDTMVAEKLYAPNLPYRKAYTLDFTGNLINDGRDIGHMEFTLEKKP
ncbi:MAG: ABC transporter substrate-binding protein [Alphaproteobacteria bacterium]|nr:ABC transporter substrate-binding protein [Alphaproteobacteria bacterium]